MSYAITHEEVANTATHFLGVLLAPIMLFFLLYLIPSHSWESQFSVIVFCLGVLIYSLCLFFYLSFYLTEPC